MPPLGALSRKRFWAGALCALAAACWLYLGRPLETGSLAAPGPGAFPLALAAIAALHGAIELLRGAVGPWRPESGAPLWQRPFAMAAGVLAVALALLAFFGPLSPYLARFGAGASFAWFVFVLTFCAAVAARLPGGSPARALGAAILGLLLGTSGLDPLAPALDRFASIESGLYFNVVHGLALAFVAHRVGLNALLIAAAVGLSPKLETALRQGLAASQGKIAPFIDHPASLALLTAALLALAIAAVLSPAKAVPALAFGRTMMLGRGAAPAPRPGLLAGLAAIAVGAAGLSFGAGLTFRGAAGSDGMVGPGAAPLALSAALAVMGVLMLARAAFRPADSPALPFARAPATIAGTALAALLLLAFLLVSLGPRLAPEASLPAARIFLQFGPVEMVALFVLLLTLCIAAAWLLPPRSLLRAAAAVALGLLLSTVGLDPITGTIRYTQELDLSAVHGLVLGFVAYRLGFNPLLIAIGFVFGPGLENALRQTMLLAQGDLSVFASRPICAALLVSGLAVLLLAAALRFWQWRRERAAGA